MNLIEHADAILDAACAAPLSRHGWTNAERHAILAACQALHDEGVRAGIEAAAHIRVQSEEIVRLKMGLAMYASDMAQFDSSKTRTALKEPGA